MPTRTETRSADQVQPAARARAIVDAVPKGLLIGGQWLDGSDGDVIDVHDPATGAVIASVAAGSIDDGVRAVTAAHDAMAGWAATAPRARAEVLRRAWQLMDQRSDDLAALIVLENGKTLNDARSEVAYAAEFFRWYGEEAVRVAGSIQTAPSGANRILTLRQPIGAGGFASPRPSTPAWSA